MTVARLLAKGTIFDFSLKSEVRLTPPALTVPLVFTRVTAALPFVPSAPN